MQGVICRENSRKISSQISLSAMNFQESEQEMVICRESL